MTRPTVSLQVDFPGGGEWVDITARCDSVSTRRGRQRFLEQFRAGTLAATLDNADGHLDPMYSAGPYWPNVRPNRPIRGIFNWNSTDWPFYHGYIDQWILGLSYPEGGSVQVAATDAFKIFNRIDPPEQAAVGEGEATGTRIARVLDTAGWSATMRDLDVGDNTHSATTLAQPITTQIRLAADSERGDLYIDARGYVTFRSKTARFSEVRSSSVQWTIGDGPGELAPSGWYPSNDEELVRNEVNLARVGGTMITRRTLDGEDPMKRSSFTRTDLTLEDDSQVADQAERILQLFGTQLPRVDAVTFEPDGEDDDAMWEMIVGALFGDRVAVKFRHPATGNLTAQDYFIEGIDHDVPVFGSGDWRTTFYLADASGWPTNPFILDSSLLDGTDVLV